MSSIRKFFRSITGKAKKSNASLTKSSCPESTQTASSSPPIDRISWNTHADYEVDGQAGVSAISNTGSLKILEDKDYPSSEELVEGQQVQGNTGLDAKESSKDQSREKSDQGTKDKSDPDITDPYDLSQPRRPGKLLAALYGQQCTEYENNVRRLREVEHRLAVDFSLALAERRALEEEKDNLKIRNDEISGVVSGSRST